MLNDLFLIWSDQPGVSLFIWFIVGLSIMYLGRIQAHVLLQSLGRSCYVALRLLSRALGRLEQVLVVRNKEVILNLGKEHIERCVAREFERVNTLIAKDLGSYPVLHRQLSEVITNIEQDYQASAESLPLPPQWSWAVETISAMPDSADPVARKILDNIKDIIVSARDETLKSYQKNTLTRQRQLGKMQPQWRALQQTLGKVKASIDGVQQHAVTLDEQMQQYQTLREADDEAVRLLSASSLTQFFVSGLVLIIALLGGLINFQLIAMPMSEMVGGTSYIGPMATSDIAALVIIMVEVAMGLFLMEALRITRLFPMISAMDDVMRKRMALIAFSILAILATVEASLAYMRDLLALDRETLQQSLAGASVVQAQFRWIPSLGQMIMGFILPFTLAFVAIPLESFIQALRTVLGLSAVMLLRLLAISSRLLANLAKQLSQVLISLYDLIILLPLSLETAVKAALQASSQAKSRRNTADDSQNPAYFEEKLS